MKDAVMVARPDGLTKVHRMHGGFGVIEWKRMAVGEMLFGDWQSVDYNQIKPGAGSAEHIQSRPFHRIGNKRLTAKISRLDKGFIGQRVTLRRYKNRIVIKEFDKLDPRQFFGIR